MFEKLRPTIEQHRDEADRLGRLPEQLVAALRDAGAFRLYTPRERGGAGTAAAGRTSICWSASAGSTASSAFTVWNLNMGLIMSALPPSGVAKLGPDPLIGNSTMPGAAVPDGDGDRLLW